MLKFRKNNKKFNKTRGFTLIEMMVSVSIFVIVAFIVVSTLLTMSYAYKRAQKMRLLMDNFNFALQSMSLNIREGKKYSLCLDGSCIKLKTLNGPEMCYSLETIGSGSDKRGYIRECTLDNNVSCPCVNRGSRLSSADIDVNKLNFTLLDPNPNIQLKAVKIMIGGVAGAGTRASTSFFIQTTVSQRNVN